MARTTVTGIESQRKISDGSWDSEEIELVTSLNQALKLSFIANDSAAVKRICTILSMIIGFRSMSMSTHFLHLSLSVALRYQALTNLGKRIR